MSPHPTVDAVPPPPHPPGGASPHSQLPGVVATLASLLDQAGASFRSQVGGSPGVGAEWLAALAAAVAEAARLGWRLDGWSCDGRDGEPDHEPNHELNHELNHEPGPDKGRGGGWADGIGACLLRTPAVEVRVVRWAAGEGTRAHDHGGAASALAVVAGELVEDGFEPPLWQATGRRRRLRAGTVVTLPADHTHVLANPGPDAATSIHVVSPPSLPTRHRSVGAASFLAELWPF